ncbi:RNA recognition motif domain [Macleaya cordata]|uniref:RNA recognition motif domain n=1 Tax=Macleaya cordata TaxID=56857 RepID=A0A200Q8S3_MACCD|nr:RNA recognition motif domain [Macleaya cordata]
MLNYLPRDDDRGGSRLIKDTKTIGSAYDRYLQSSQNPSFSSGEPSNFGSGARLERGVGGGMPGLLSAGETSILGGRGPVGTDLASNGRGLGFGSQLPIDPMVRPGREVLPLPPDASNTLFVEGLSPDCTRREVAHIFRPFLGFKEVRLVTKESKHRGGDPLVLCFVDFQNPACAATALSALQGYNMDEHESDSHILRLQFARYPGPRSGHGPRGKR